MKSFFTTTVLALMLLCAGTVNAQVKFSAAVSPENAGRDEYVTLRFTAENAHAIESIKLPSLNDFTIVSGPNQESGMSNINGKVNEFMALSYILKPRHKGRITIPAATASIAGKPYRCNSVTVNITDAPGRGNSGGTSQQNPFAGFDPFEEDRSAAQFQDYILRKGENVQDKVSKNMQLRLQTDKTSVYVGEPVVAAYKLYTRLKSESSLSKNPSLNGFSVIDMTEPDVTAYTRETLNGKEYNVYIIRKAQLYPLQAGPAELESATIDNKIQFIKYTGTNNNGAFSIDPDALITENVSLSTKPLIINVKPLPEAGKPASFKGAVGKFQMDASLEHNSFSTDETGNLVITIGGSGNMQLLTAPDVQWPVAVEVFDTKVTDNIDNATVPISGSKVFQIPFSVQQPGSYTLPAVTFSYFDPATGSYKTLTSKALSFTVTKGTGKPAAAFTEQAKNTDSAWDKFFANRILVITLVGAIIIFFVVLWMRKEKKTEAAVTEQQIVPATDPVEEAAAASQQNPLAKTEACLLQEECVEFYAVLSGEVKEFFRQKFNITDMPVNPKTLSIVMDKAGTDNELSLQSQQLLRDIEWQLYTPFEKSEALNEMYARAQTIIQMINMQRS